MSFSRSSLDPALVKAMMAAVRERLPRRRGRKKEAPPLCCGESARWVGWRGRRLVTRFGEVNFRRPYRVPLSYVLYSRIYHAGVRAMCIGGSVESSRRSRAGQ